MMLNESKQLKITVDKDWKRISILRQFKFLVDRKSLERMYLVFSDLFLNMVMLFGKIAQMNSQTL